MSIGQRLLAILFCYTPSLETLLLRKTDFGVYRDLDIIVGKLGFVLRSTTLPNLSTLQLQHSPKPKAGRVEFSGYSFIIAENFLNLGKPTRLHLWRDSGFHSFYWVVLPGQESSWIRGIRELRIEGATFAKYIYRICREAVRLESLSLVISNWPGRIVGSLLPPDPDTSSPGPNSYSNLFFPFLKPPQGRNLCDAIALRAETLKVLELRICDHEWFLAQIGDSGQLRCLPQLTKLEHLTIEAPIAFQLENRGLFQLSRELPPNLVSLNLVEAWRFHGIPLPGPPRPFVEALEHRGSTDRPHLQQLIREIIMYGPSQCRSLRHFCYLYSSRCPQLTPEYLSFFGALLEQPGSQLSFSHKEDDIKQTSFCINPPQRYL